MGIEAQSPILRDGHIFIPPSSNLSLSGVDRKRLGLKEEQAVDPGDWEAWNSMYFLV